MVNGERVYRIGESGQWIPEDTALGPAVWRRRVRRIAHLQLGAIGLLPNDLLSVIMGLLVGSRLDGLDA